MKRLLPQSESGRMLILCIAFGAAFVSVACSMAYLITVVVRSAWMQCS